MKAINREINDKGHIILTCQESMFFGLYKPITKFIATKEYPKGYWDWRELPNKTLVGDSMSFQLNSWKNDFD